MNCQLTVNSLVVGYGNSLRGDDRIGLEIARTVADWNLPQVNSLYLPQLVPELAAELAKVDLVLFVDAYAANIGDEIRITQLDPATSANFDTHLSNPQALLNLTQTLFQKCPSSWWILVPGNDFELGDWLTPTARKGIEQASNIIKNLLEIDSNNNQPLNRPTCSEADDKACEKPTGNLLPNRLDMERPLSTDQIYARS